MSAFQRQQLRSVTRTRMHPSRLIECARMALNRAFGCPQRLVAETRRPASSKRANVTSAKQVRQRV
jgi:hypothetical protein